MLYPLSYEGGGCRKGGREPAGEATPFDGCCSVGFILAGSGLDDTP